MNRKKNLTSALIYQISHMIYGLLIPKMTLEAFGSDINGLVSSITQFLSFISLFEGGLGAVALSELYRPIEEKNNEQVKNVIRSCQGFFHKIAVFFVIYTIVLSNTYSFFVRDKYDDNFIISLTFVLSLTTLAEYLFSITYKLFLQASQKIYIVNYLNSAILYINILIAFIVIKWFPNIIILKLFSSIAFFIQPIIYHFFIPKEYSKINKHRSSKSVLKNRWSGFAQNLAHYVNMNTDIVLITIFGSFNDVSIYSVYLLGVNAIRVIISSITNSYHSSLGLYIARKDQKNLESQFKKFFLYTCCGSISLFCTCMLVVNQFVSIYTRNVSDCNYYQPYFALVIILSNLLYCIREPFRLLILASGMFKETNFGSMMEAVLNLSISLILIKPLGLIGIAIGTFVAIFYRMVYFIFFLKNRIIKLRLREYTRYIYTGTCLIIINIILYILIDYNIESFLQFFFLAFIVLLFECFVSCLFFIGVKQVSASIKRFIEKINLIKR